MKKRIVYSKTYVRNYGNNQNNKFQSPTKIISYSSDGADTIIKFSSDSLNITTNYYEE